MLMGPPGEAKCLLFHLNPIPTFLHILIQLWSGMALPTAPCLGAPYRGPTPPACLLLRCRADGMSGNIQLPRSSQGMIHRLWGESMAKRWKQGHGCALGDSQVRMSSNSLFLRRSPMLSQQDLAKPEATERPRGQPSSTPSWKNLDLRNLMPCRGAETFNSFLPSRRT